MGSNQRRWIRTYSCSEGNELIPRIAKEMGINTLVGAWLGNDPKINERKITGLIKLTNEGLVDIAAVGNEVLTFVFEAFDENWKGSPDPIEPENIGAYFTSIAHQKEQYRNCILSNLKRIYHN